MKKTILFFALAGLTAIAAEAPPAARQAGYDAAKKQNAVASDAKGNPVVRRAVAAMGDQPVEKSGLIIPGEKQAVVHRAAVPLPKIVAGGGAKKRGAGGGVSSYKIPAANGSHQPVFKQPSIAAAAHGAMLNKATAPPPVKPAPKVQVASGPAALSPGRIRNSAASTAAVFQPGRSKIASSAAGITGTGMKHKKN